MPFSKKNLLQFSIFLFTFVFLTACGDDSSDNDSDLVLALNASSNSGEALRPASSDEDFIISLRAALRAYSPITTSTATTPILTTVSTTVSTSGDFDSGASFAESSSSSEQFSGTYTLEENVDEITQVSYNGEHIFISPIRQSSCCFATPLLAETDLQSGDESQNNNSVAPPPQGVRILATNPATAAVTPVAVIDLADENTVQGLFVKDDTLATVTTSYYRGSYGHMWQSLGPWQGNSTEIKLFDISNISNPNEINSITIEGSFVESRRIGNTMYVISRHSPDYYTMGILDGNNETSTATLNQLSFEDIVPRLTVNGQTSNLFNGSECFIENPGSDLANVYPAFPAITTISAINIVTGSVNSTCYNQSAQGIYMSENAIYFVEGIYSNQSSKTRIHKFALSEELSSYKGSATVNGTIWLGGNRDFRINEFNGDLRLITTKFSGTGTSDSLDHELHILRQSPTTLKLNKISTLPNTRRPDELGKPNEQLYGVRFFGDRAYLVTFQQTDPLYILDLSNPEDPFIAGELEVPGFSDFLHPVNDELLLGIGSENSNVKVELFDISDISAPSSLKSIIQSSQYSSTEAQYNRHAFTWLSLNGNTSRFTIPVRQYNANSSTYGLNLYEINAASNTANTDMGLIGTLLAEPASENNEWFQRGRSVLHDEAVYFIANESVYTAFWNSPENQQGPF